MIISPLPLNSLSSDSIEPVEVEVLSELLPPMLPLMLLTLLFELDLEQAEAEEWCR